MAKARNWDSYDVIVVGGGHAGCEAAAAAARIGARTALVSMRRDMIGAMSCNPAMGGLGKGHLIREVDAFDGLIGRASDAAAIHYRMLNASKGAAVRGPRIQADRKLYRAAIHQMLDDLPELDIVEAEATALALDDSGRTVTGLVVDGGERTLAGKTVILATGTFLGARLHFGMDKVEGGRIGERAATELAKQLYAARLPMARLKTGTPPRLDGRTIDWAGLEMQASDGAGWTMGFMTGRRVNPELFCGITRTNRAAHDIIRASLDRSPLFSGVIEGQGPRYCPSIEDKIHRFGDRDGHQIFLEPEGLDDALVYPNGISTSLPKDVQHDFLRAIPGLESVDIAEAGYAVEYDHVDPRILGHDLGVRTIPGLYLAGQINGTTGYEEAAAQGLVAGINAARRAAGEDPVKLDRDISYIGVMIDDLVLQGVTEPYRMLTARAEYRLRLRADNAVTRLSALAEQWGCLGAEFRAKRRDHAQMRQALAAQLDRRIDGARAAEAGVATEKRDETRTLAEWLRLPGGDAASLRALWIQLVADGDAGEAEVGSDVPDAVYEETVEDVRYAPYLERQDSELARIRADEKVRIPDGFDYRAIAGLSNEMTERLETARPETLAEAARIRGISPAALAAILVHLRRRAA